MGGKELINNYISLIVTKNMHWKRIINDRTYLISTFQISQREKKTKAGN